jgi:NAD(P)H-flavin reductase
MIRPRRSSLLLGRPLSVAAWYPAEGAAGVLGFLITRRGRGTAELADLRPGELADLTGPLGNAWTGFLPRPPFPGGKKIALIGGGVGIAPLEALLGELPPGAADFYAGFRTGFASPGEREGLLGPALGTPGLVIATDDGSAGRRGRGTAELADLRPGERADLTGPLGNAWTGFLPRPPFPGEKKIALIGGGVGIAPLEALLGELPPGAAAFYAGFRTGFASPGEREGLLGPALTNPGLVIATEDGSEGFRGRILEFLDPAKYGAVCACGPEPMLKAVAARCQASGAPCFLSLERRMACGTGACLGCTLRTRSGNKRCCADGPIFPGEELIFDE